MLTAQMENLFLTANFNEVNEEITSGPLRNNKTSASCLTVSFSIKWKEKFSSGTLSILITVNREGHK